MFSFIQRQFHRVSSTSADTRKRLRNRSRNRTRDPGPSLALESLEARLLLAELDLGNITNPATLQFVNGAINDLSEVGAIERFKFSLGRSAVVIAALSDLQRVRIFDSDLFGDLSIVSLDASGEVIDTVASKTFFENTVDELRISLPPGEYAADFVSDIADGNVNRFDIAIHADTASAAFGGGTFNPSALTGRSLGTLSTATGVNVTEYIGFGNSSPDGPVLNDVADVYFVNLVKQGTVDFSFVTGVGNDGNIDFTVFRDLNNDGVFQHGTAEEIVSRTAIGPGKSITESPVLPAARYGIEVTIGPFALSQSNHYQLRTTYRVADDAGNSTAAARDIGTLDNTIRTFSDYLSSVDTVDIYKFTTLAGGPFIFESLLTDVIFPGTNFVVDLVRGSDNGVIFHDVPAEQETSSQLTVAGTYFLKVRRISGEGPYTLSMSNRNLDLAGNDFVTAKNLGSLFGRKRLSDFVSNNDTDDFYKFTLTAAGTISASFPATAANTNANLQLVQALPNSNVLLTSSNNTGNAGESLSAGVPAGTYFVRVQRIAGSPLYDMFLAVDTAGSSLGKARVLSETGSANEFVGPGDSKDVFRVNLSGNRRLGALVLFAHNRISLAAGNDANNNQILDAFEKSINVTIDDSGKQGFTAAANILQGTVIIEITALGTVGTNYSLSLGTAPFDNAGNTLAAARPLGTLSTAQNFADFVGDGSSDRMDDLDDFYHFTLGNNGKFLFQSVVSNLGPLIPNRSAVIELIRDDNLNLQRDAGEVVGSTIAIVVNGANVPGVISTILDVPGNYYLRVKRDSGQVDYSLTLSAISLDTAGNSLSSVPPPLDLGPLVNTINSAGHFIGRIDRDDFFRFSVNNPGELAVSVEGVSNFVYEVIHDVNENGVINSGEILAIVFGDRPLHGVFLPAADDNYYVRVQSVFSSSVFALTLTFSNQTPFLTPILISATVPTEIKAVRFDKGGEGVSYHDTTPGNNGDQPGFRSGENIDVDVSNTADPVSGGRRVTNTAPGEFLEYMIDVAENGTYDFDVRVSSPDLGATFHLEIDDVELSPPIAVPDTNGEDNMVTIVGASNLFLSRGPHLLRLVIDTDTVANNDFAGSFNFITARPASAGTFDLTLQHTTVAAYQHVNLELAWTVPVGGWRTLKQVDLRLRDDNGRLIWIRFDEATNRMSLYNQITGKFETEKEVGSYGVLRSPLANVYMKTTTIAANGAGDPTVVITFDIKFKAIARGHWTVEAAATDDLGHNDPFAFAGTLDVV